MDFKDLMALLGFNLEEAEQANKQIKKLKNLIKKNKDFKESLLTDSEEYKEVKRYFKILCSYLMYRCDSIKQGTNFYRVRPLGLDEEVTSKSGLLYPTLDVATSGRMNNKIFNVMYTSFNEFTACMETGIFKKKIGDRFQLTRFKSNRDLGVYRLGTFSEIYFNLPRDSEAFNAKMEYYKIPSQSTLKGFSALENLLLGVLYSKDDSSYLLSSILAHAIFEKNEEYSPNRIDAILYPSQQSTHGINLAFKTSVADELEVTFTCLNKLEKKYTNKMIKYYTLKECMEITSDEILYDDVKSNCIWR